MDGRYEVFATHGKGVFSTVLRARDQQCGSGPSEVAIKIIRANETMSKAAQTEKVLLTQLQAALLPHSRKPALLSQQNQQQQPSQQPQQHLAGRAMWVCKHRVCRHQGERLTAGVHGFRTLFSTYYLVAHLGTSLTCLPA